MSYKIIDKRFIPLTNVVMHDYIIDTDEDVANLPNASAGSHAVSLATGKVFVVNTQGKWVAFGGE